MTKTDTPHNGPRATEFIAPLIAVVALALGLAWYMQRVSARIEAVPERRPELNLAYPDRRPAPGFPAR